MATTAQLQQLLDQLQLGNDAAREALLDASMERIRLLVRKMFPVQDNLRRYDETDDVLNKAMTRLHRALAEVKPPNVKAFHCLAAAHVRWVLGDLAREHKTLSRVTYGTPPTQPLDLEGGPADLLEWVELHEAIEGLPECEREVCDLVFYQGLEQAEAASILDVPLRTLKRRWQRARLMLREKLPGGPGQ